MKSMNGWPMDPVTRSAKVNGRAATVRKGPVRKLFLHFGWAYHRKVEAITTFNGYRSASLNNISGSVFSTSNHRSATAVDINGFKYPYEATRPVGWYNTMPAATQAKVRAILKQIPELGWGTDFNRPYRDPMHYEFRTGTTTAQLKKRVKSLGLGKRKLKKKCALYAKPDAKSKVTRNRKKGRFVRVVHVDGKWGMTKKGDWIKLGRLK